MLILAVYTSAIAALVGRVAQRHRAPAFLWVLATAAIWAVCGGQAILADVFGGGALLGGGWFTLAGLGIAAGGVVALALHVLPAARELIHELAPKLRELVAFTVATAQPPATPQLSPITRSTRGRAPPALA
jgi:hypothetical protein